jgi:benzoylformate decarboxylase
MGDALLGDVGLSLRALADAVGDSDREAPPVLPPAPQPEPSDPLTPGHVGAALRSVWPDGGILTLESPSSTIAIRNHLRLSEPGSYFFGAGGGLGFGMPAALGVALAQPDRPVVSVVGEGSAQYAIQSLWTAAAYDIGVTFVVPRNDEYGILKWFGELENVTGAPGLDLPALDSAALARAYGVESHQVTDEAELRERLATAIESGKPQLLEVPVTPGMSLG